MDNFTGMDYYIWITQGKQDMYGKLTYFPLMINHAESGIRTKLSDMQRPPRRR